MTWVYILLTCLIIFPVVGLEQEEPKRETSYTIAERYPETDIGDMFIILREDEWELDTYDGMELEEGEVYYRRKK